MRNPATIERDVRSTPRTSNEIRPLGLCFLMTAAVLLGLAVMAFAPGSGLAAEAVRIGVIDPQAVLEKSKAGKRALDRLKKYTEARQRILNDDEKEIKQLEEQLRTQGAQLPEDQKQQMEEKFRGKLQDYQRRVQEFQQELSQKQKELVDEYMRKISKATKVVAEKEGLALVVDKGSESTIQIVIYNETAADVTDKVIAEFDRQNK